MKRFTSRRSGGHVETADHTGLVVAKLAADDRVLPRDLRGGKSEGLRFARFHSTSPDHVRLIIFIERRRDRRTRPHQDPIVNDRAAVRECQRHLRPGGDGIRGRAEREIRHDHVEVGGGRAARRQGDHDREASKDRPS